MRDVNEPHPMLLPNIADAKLRYLADTCPGEHTHERYPSAPVVGMLVAGLMFVPIRKKPCE